MSRPNSGEPGLAHSGGRHLSTLTSLRRWRFRHSRPPGRHEAVAGPDSRSRRLARKALWTLVALGSLFVYLLTWRLIGQEVSVASRSGAAGGRVLLVAARQPGSPSPDAGEARDGWCCSPHESSRA